LTRCCTDDDVSQYEMENFHVSLVQLFVDMLFNHTVFGLGTRLTRTKLVHNCFLDLLLFTFSVYTYQTKPHNYYLCS
jgi:hypothetical protein